jgi:signal transduction histidine kinase
VNEVSCKVFGVLVRPLAEKGIALADVVEGTQVGVARLLDKKERIDWADYLQIMRNVRRHFTDEEYIELGRSYMRTPGLRFAFVIARMLFSPMDLYRWFSKPGQGVGNQMFNCIIPSHKEIGDNEIELDLVMPDGMEPCWDFYVISIGNLEEIPRLFGLPRAEVHLTRIEQGGRFRIKVPPQKPLVSRAFRLLTWPFDARAAARELKDAHETLIERYAELEEARATLDRQAAQLRTAHTVNELVQRDIDLTSTLHTVAKALVEEAGFEWAEIRLIPVDEDTPNHAMYGTPTDDEPIRCSLDGRGGERVGDLYVTPRRGANRREREDLLAFITPALAIALQNALYRSGLEKLVDIRTNELRHARDQLAGTVQQLRDAQGARERFFANISHEIRTPLSIVLLAVADIDRRAGELLDEQARASLGAVSDSARKLVRLVDELLLLAAGQENKLRIHPEPTDLAGLLRNIFAAWRPGAEAAGLELSIAAPTTLVVNVDSVAIERVVSNLVSNAIKYTAAGGRVHIELAFEDDVRLSVLDTGRGIDAELAGRMFQRFERAHDDDRKIPGTGLGLALAKQLVVAHGGTIAHHPRVSGGTEMRVLLPRELVCTHGRSEPPALKLPELASAPPSSSLRELAPEGLAKGTIVLAEDDTRLAEMIARLLGDEYRVHIASNGIAALELVKEHQPELLITDIDMPGLDGLELSRRFRELTNDRLAPIIILSALVDLGTRLEGLEAGAIDYVAKPFDPRELKARVHAQFRMRELAVRLHRAEQLSSLGVLTSGLAHELRNPANGIVNAIGPLRDLLPAELTSPDHPVGQLVEVIDTCAQQLGVLSKQLLGFHSGGGNLLLRTVPLREVVQRALSVCRSACAGVDVQLELDHDARIHCAPPLLTQVLSNLIENAAHAAGAGGWLRVRGRVENGHAIIEISDSGPGVPVALRDKIFEPFFTTKPQGVGTGLGLSISRDIVARHGGTIELRDRGGRHAFVIDLPHDSGTTATATAV